eukprot:TRINITY_DN19020_c0_g1_i1.p1 TRINITY_DN19020_c0_g1~~TRINITY_DN19020_c0_g1_i1.p1  ORF type:complete len:299 (+),score=50.13 TRINITY_DN19020_c0_g1_i1:267-1163(+)
MLDLATLKWCACDASLPDPVAKPSPRNSHSATLLQVPFLGDAVLIVGGGTGCESNGGPPRGGRDLTDSWWLSGLESGGPFKWTRAPNDAGRPVAAGRGHVACRLDGTGTILTVGGGLPPRNMCVAFDAAKGGLAYGGDCHVVEMERQAAPYPRAFGGGCALPGGSVLIYGGWHPRFGTFRDVWIGHVGSAETELFKQVPEIAVQETLPQDDDIWQAENEEDDSDDLDEDEEEEIDAGAVSDEEGGQRIAFEDIVALTEEMETSDEDEEERSDSCLREAICDADSAEATLEAIEASWER